MLQAKKRGYELYPPAADSGKDVRATERIAYIRGYEDAWAALHALTDDEAKRLSNSFMVYVDQRLRKGDDRFDRIGMEWMKRHCVRQEGGFEFLPFLKAFVARDPEGGLKLFVVDEDGWHSSQPGGPFSCDCATLGLPEELFPELGQNGMEEVELSYRVLRTKKIQDNEKEN